MNISNELKFKFRFFKGLVDPKQYVFMLESASMPTPLLIEVNTDFTLQDIYSAETNPVADLSEIAGLLSCQNGSKLKDTIIKAIESGFENHRVYGFDFTIRHTLGCDEFELIEVNSPFTQYTKNVNSYPYEKVFSHDLGAVIAEAKFVAFENEESWIATQLNVDVLFDEQDQIERYYIELENKGRWYDATTFESDDDVAKYFSDSPVEVLEAIKNLSYFISMNFEQEWKSIYTEDGEYLNLVAYEQNLSN